MLNLSFILYVNTHKMVFVLQCQMKWWTRPNKNSMYVSTQISTLRTGRVRKRERERETNRDKHPDGKSHTDGSHQHSTEGKCGPKCCA